jgi:preprotein translocase subunit SecE
MARQGKTRSTRSGGARANGGGGQAPAATAPAPKKPFNPLRFFSEVRQEGRKVTWTSRQETIVSTIMVVIMATLAAIFFFAVDSLISWIINTLLGLG